MQVAQQQAAIGVGIGAHAPLTVRRQRGQLGAQTTVLVEQLCGPVAAQPVFQQLQVPGLIGRVQWHLMRTKVALDGLAVDLLRSCPALG